MNSFLEKIRMFMYGRNGVDKLSFATLFAYLLINGIKMFFYRIPAVYYTMWAVALAFLAVTVFRVLSKNLDKRRSEAARFEQFLISINFNGMMFKLRKKFNRLSMRISQFSTHRFRTCPQCKEHLRLSKKRGKRKITCPKCGRKFTTFIPF